MGMLVCYIWVCWYVIYGYVGMIYMGMLVCYIDLRIVNDWDLCRLLGKLSVWNMWLGNEVAIHCMWNAHTYTHGVMFVILIIIRAKISRAVVRMVWMK